MDGEIRHLQRAAVASTVDERSEYTLFNQALDQIAGRPAGLRQRLGGRAPLPRGFTRGPVAPGSVNLWDEYQEWKETTAGREARRARGLLGTPQLLRSKLASSSSRTSTR
jgi:hypothetical protein